MPDTIAEPKAENNREAVLVTQWHDFHVLAVGDETKEEWLEAPARIGLDLSECA